METDISSDPIQQHRLEWEQDRREDLKWVEDEIEHADLGGLNQRFENTKIEIASLEAQIAALQSQIEKKRTEVDIIANINRAYVGMRETATQVLVEQSVSREHAYKLSNYKKQCPQCHGWWPAIQIQLMQIPERMLHAKESIQKSDGKTFSQVCYCPVCLRSLDFP